MSANLIFETRLPREQPHVAKAPTTENYLNSCTLAHRHLTSNTYQEAESTGRRNWGRGDLVHSHLALARGEGSTIAGKTIYQSLVGGGVQARSYNVTLLARVTLI